MTTPSQIVDAAMALDGRASQAAEVFMDGNDDPAGPRESTGEDEGGEAGLGGGAADAAVTLLGQSAKGSTCLGQKATVLGTKA